MKIRNFISSSMVHKLSAVFLVSSVAGMAPVFAQGTDPGAPAAGSSESAVSGMTHGSGAETFNADVKNC